MNNEVQAIYLPLSGLSLSPVLFGGWQAGREYWPDATDADSIAAHRAARDAGITSFDTAESYGDGHSERVLAAALGTASSSARAQIRICTKVAWDHLTAPQVAAACARSLTNLQTDHIDLYQIHWPAGSFGSPAVPVAETMGALLRLREQGKIRAIGVSNFNREQLAEALACGPVEALQPCRSLFWRQGEQDTLPLCRAHNIAVLAYSPLAQGLLTGRFTPGHVFAEGDNRADNLLFKEPHISRALAVLDRLRPLAGRCGTSLAGLALAWLHNEPQTGAIVGARTADQARTNAASMGVRISAEDREEMGRMGMEVYAGMEGKGMMWEW